MQQIKCLDPLWSTQTHESLELYVSQAFTDLGEITVVMDPEDLLFLGIGEIGEEPAGLSSFLGSLTHSYTLIDSSLPQWLMSSLLNGVYESTEPALGVIGGEFKVEVFKALKQTSLGTLLSYGDLAKKIGRPKSARAVGTALANNTIAILIPCHRVIRANGQFGQFRWGTERKRILIERERSKHPPMKWIKRQSAQSLLRQVQLKNIH